MVSFARSPAVMITSSLVRSHAEVRFTDDLDSAEKTIVTLAMTIEARDPCTGGHCERLAGHAVRLGRQLGLSDDDLRALERGGYLHDIGQVAIPDSILLKPGALTEQEHEVMRQHTVIGDRLCSELASLKGVQPIVRSHHERLDGSGYPDGLAGDAIPLLAQVISVVDAYDAMIGPRPYRMGIPHEAAAAELQADVTRGWKSAELVHAFLRLF